jgi:hypothetical protein
MKDGKIVGTLIFKGALAQYSFDDADDHPKLPDGIGPDLWCERCTLVPYVCPDKHGKAMFVGDPVKHRHATGTLVADMVSGIGIKVHENLTIALTPLQSESIELIEGEDNG